MSISPPKRTPMSTSDILDNPYTFLDDTIKVLLLENERNPLPLPLDDIFVNLMNVEISSRDMHIVINQLKKDGYVDAIVYTKQQTQKDGIPLLADTELYFVTFSGAKLLHEGGYTTFYEKEVRQKKIQNLKDWLIIFGSWMAGIGTVFLFLVEIIKFFVLKGYRWFFSMQMLQLWILLALGIVLGIAVTVLLSQASKALKK